LIFGAGLKSSAREKLAILRMNTTKISLSTRRVASFCLARGFIPEHKSKDE
jgi:hypothetical protein